MFGPRLVCMPALRQRDDTSPEAYARLSLIERLDHVEEALADYKQLIRETPKAQRVRLKLALMPFYVSLRRHRDSLRHQIAHQARD